MYNKKVLIDSLKSLGNAKAPTKKPDVVVNVGGQWNPPIQNYGFGNSPEQSMDSEEESFEEGGDVEKEFISSKDGVETPIYKQVSVKPSEIEGKGLFADEHIRKGEPIGVSHIRKTFEKGGSKYQAPFPSTVLGMYNHSKNPNVYEVDNGDHIVMVALRDIKPNEELTSDYDKTGISDLQTSSDFKKGGETNRPKIPKNKNSRGYSRSLEATNRFFAENRFFAKPKSRKNKVYDPNAKYYQDGGIQECDEDGRCEETDQIQNYLDTGSQIPYQNVGLMWDVQQAVNPEGKYPGDASKEWAKKGAQSLASYLGMSNPANCMWAAGMGYQCLPETKGKLPKSAFKSNDSFISAVNKGTVPFSRVAKTNESDFDSKEKGLLQPGDIINFKGTNDTGDAHHPNTSHAMTFSHYREDGTPIYLDSNGEARDFNWNQGVWSGMKPNKKRTAYISRFNPEMFYADPIKILEEKARTNPTYINTELTPEEIVQYAKGGYIIEDISVPELNKANKGMVVKGISKLPGLSSLKPLSTTAKIAPSILNLRDIPLDFKASELGFPLTVNGDSGYWALIPNKKVEDNLWHFSTSMTNPIEAGRTMQLLNQAFPYPNPSVLEPHSLSLDSYKALLNMSKRKDWDLNFENHIPLNYTAQHSNLFEGIEGLPKGFRTTRVIKPETAEEMLTRLNGYLKGRGIEQQAYQQTIPGSGLTELRIPNFRATRRYGKGGLAKANYGVIVKDLKSLAPKVEELFSPNLVKTFATLGETSKNLPVLNHVTNNYLRGLSSYINIPTAAAGSKLDLPGLNSQQTQKLLERMPMMENDFLQQYSGYNPIFLGNDQSIVTGGLTGHKAPFQNFDRSFRGSGLGNQEGGAYFTPHPDFALRNAQDSSLGGYFALNRLSKTFTPYVSEALFKNPESFINNEVPMSKDLIKKIGLINGVDPSQFRDFGDYENALRNSFNPTGAEELYKATHGPAADAIREKGFTGQVGHGEIVVFDEGDITKIKQHEIYKDLDDALVRSYLKAVSKSEAEQTEADKKLISSFNEYLTTGNKQKLIDRKLGGAFKKLRNGGPSPIEEEPEVTDCPEGYTYDDTKGGCVPASEEVIDPAKEWLSNWYEQREIQFPEHDPIYEKTMKKILPYYNETSPVLENIENWPGYVYQDELFGKENAAGVYDLSTKNPKIYIKKGLDPKEEELTKIHEGTTHLNAAVRDQLYPLQNNILEQNLIPLDKKWSPEQKEFYNYVTAPDEDNYHSYLMNARKQFGVDPKQVVTEEDVNTWRKQAEESGMMDKESPNYNEEIYLLFKLAKDPASLVNIFNHMASNNTPSEDDPQYAKFGGSTDYELGDEIDEATKRKLEKLGYTFEKI